MIKEQRFQPKRTTDPFFDIGSVGKLPPQVLDIEEVVLGTLLSDPASYIHVASLLNAEMFYKESHLILYKAIAELKKSNKQVDVFTVAEHLRSTNELELVGGDFKIHELSLKYTNEIKQYALLIIEKYIQREVIRQSSLLIRAAYEGFADTFDLLGDTKKMIQGIENLMITNKDVSFQSQVDEAVADIRVAMNTPNHIPGLSTGYSNIDNITLGRNKSDLVILAGRPGMGKTTYAINEILNISQSHTVLFFSLEMSANQLVKKMLSQMMVKELNDLRTGYITPDEYERLLLIASELIRRRIIINDAAAISISEIQAVSRKMDNIHGIKAVYLDYLQLIKGERNKGDSRDVEIGSISRGLKVLAKDLNIPVIALSQLSRETEKTGDKRPLLSHLRESGNIEQDADVVQFIYRPEYYSIKQISIDNRDVDTTNLTEISTMKNRNGACGFDYLMFRKEISKFTEYQIQETQQHWNNEPREEIPF